MKPENLFVITGQTATGKTALALQKAHELQGEVISADSRQVYKYLDIITGKDLEIFKKAAVPLHLVDMVTPDIGYSSHEYAVAARAAITDIRARGKTPIVVGGSYMYLKHLLYGFDVQVPPNPELRDELNTKTVSELQELLTERPSNINDSDWHNPHRLIRRIEIQRSAVIPDSIRDPEKSEPWIPASAGMTIQFIGLKHATREALEERINERIQTRLQHGAIEEVEKLMQKGYRETDPGMKTIGYQQIMKYLIGEYTKDQAIKVWTTREIQYAKRQLTFMRTDKNIAWSDL